MGLLRLLGEDPLVFFLILVILSMSLVLHELGHAVSAYWMGDSTAKNQGRITLNPFKHLDPFGTIMLLIAGFGWARPVPIYPPNFRNYRLGLFVVSIAGIVVNLILAVIFALVLRWLVDLYPGLLRGSGSRNLAQIVGLALYYAASINVALAVFNLLPVVPLDGSKIIQSLLPLRWHPFIWRLEANANYAIIAMLLFLTVLRQPVANLIDWVQDRFFRLF
jgi:Zn-dependent protease